MTGFGCCCEFCGAPYEARIWATPFLCDPCVTAHLRFEDRRKLFSQAAYQRWRMVRSEILRESA